MAESKTLEFTLAFDNSHPGPRFAFHLWSCQFMAKAIFHQLTKVTLLLNTGLIQAS
jgi:hypothetical protein